MVPRISYVEYSNRDPNRSISEHSDFLEINALTKKLHLWAWDCLANEFSKIIPVFEHKRFKHNDCFTQPGSNSCNSCIILLLSTVKVLAKKFLYQLYNIPAV